MKDLIVIALMAAAELPPQGAPAGTEVDIPLPRPRPERAVEPDRFRCVAWQRHFFLPCRETLIIDAWREV